MSPATDRSARGVWSPAFLAADLARGSEVERLLGAYTGTEIAGPESESWRFVNRAGLFQEVPHTSRILQTRSGLNAFRHNRLGELYDEMLESDTDLAAQVLRRQRAVLAVPRTIDPADDSPASVEAAQLCRYAVGQVPLFHEVLKKLLEAPTRGIHFSELLWERLSRGPYAGAWVPVDMKDRPMHRFAFAKGTHRLHARQQGRAEPLPVPPAKVLSIRSGTRDSPWGTPELDYVYWIWYVKRLVSKYYMVWLEKWAHPLPVVEYPHAYGDHAETANKQQVDKALSLMAAIRTEFGVAVPKNLVLRYLESARNGSITYEPFMASAKAAYSMLVCGEVNTSGLGDSPGSYAETKITNSVRLEVVSQDGHLVSSALNESLIRWIVELNLGLDAPRPRFTIHTVDAEDRQMLVEGVDHALEAGVAVPLAHARRTWRVPAPIEGEEVVEPRPQQSSGGLFPFAAPGPVPTSAPGLRPRPLRLAAAPDQDLQELDRLAESHEAELAALVERLRRPTFEYYAAHQAAVLAAWDEGGGPGASGGTGLLVRTVRRLGQLPVVHARALQAAGLHGAGLALWQLRGEMSDAVQLAHQAPPGGYERADTPEAAIEFWARQLQVDPSSFDELDDLLRRFAFRVAGVEDSALLGQVHRLVEESIVDGIPRTEFRERLAQLYETAGLTPTSDWHADLIYDNNIRQAHEAVRHRQIVDTPAVHRLVPYLRWLTLADGLVRERPQYNHAVMHGYTAATGQPIWQVWSPPAGHKCRCRRQLINARRAQRMALTGAEPSGPWPIDPATGSPALPDQGFRSAARTQIDDAGAAADLRAGGLLGEAQAAGATDLVAALEQLFALLGLLRRLGD